MPRKKVSKAKHEVTVDLILDLYKNTKLMDQSKKDEAVDKIKKLVKYMGKKINIDLNDLEN